MSWTHSVATRNTRALGSPFILTLLLTTFTTGQALGQTERECPRPDSCVDGETTDAAIDSPRSVDLRLPGVGASEPTAAYEQVFPVDPRSASVEVTAAVFDVQGQTSVNVAPLAGAGISRIALDFVVLADGEPVYHDSRELTKTELVVGGSQVNPFRSPVEPFQVRVCLDRARSLTVRVTLRARGDIGGLVFGVAPGAVSGHLQANRFAASITPCSIDSDRDGFGVASDCDDHNNVIHPDSADVCDGLDNDCNAASRDGSGEPRVGRACDGADADLCRNGSIQCVESELVCVDRSTLAVDLCDGMDNDCNASTVDGSGEPDLGSRCDGSDADACAEGSYVCEEGRMTCTDDSADSPEVCDSVDNDCDGTIDEDLSVDGDGDGHYAYGACGAPADDCYDADPTRFECNTPAGSDVRPFEAGECVAGDGSALEIVYSSVASPGDTTCSVERCDLEPPDAPGFTLSHAGACFDIQTCAGFECSGVTTCSVEICIDYDESTLEGTCRLGRPEDCLTMLLIDCSDRNGDGDYDDVGECTPGAGLTRSEATNPATDRFCAHLSDPNELQRLECAPSASDFELARLASAVPMSIDPSIHARATMGPKQARSSLQISPSQRPNTIRRVALAVDDRDSDFDGLTDPEDNCDFAYNPSQLDRDDDGVGDGCDVCPSAADPTQADRDGDLVGDVCDTCPGTPDPKQQDGDGDGVGDACAA